MGCVTGNLYSVEQFPRAGTRGGLWDQVGQGEEPRDQRVAVGEDCLIGAVFFVKGTQDTADTDNLALTSSSDGLVHPIG